MRKHVDVKMLHRWSGGANSVGGSNGAGGDKDDNGSGEQLPRVSRLFGRHF